MTSGKQNRDEKKIRKKEERIFLQPYINSPRILCLGYYSWNMKFSLEKVMQQLAGFRTTAHQ